MYVIADLTLYWPKIVGDKFANSYKIIPLKITTKKTNLNIEQILHIRAPNHAIKTEVFFQESVIIERIKIYLGKKVVDKIKIVIDQNHYNKQP